MTVAIARRLRAFWSNPVVTRDLRVRMRGSKSYWHQAFYLLLLGLLALAGYGTAAGWTTIPDPTGISIVEVQQRLQMFYYFIFVTLAALITIIAPALTAVSITTERQRLSLDLLVTTPLSASELLVGKMISSVAFLALLLALSLPASALCVILGGATLGDVIRVYLLLAIDGLVLAAIGLAISCTVRASLPALVWSYLMVGLLIIITTFFAGGLFSGYGRAGADVVPSMALAVLDPFIAVFAGSKSFLLFGAEIPLWVGAAVAAFFLIRLLVTAATYRLGRYGGNPIGSLRRQLLFISGLTAFCVTYSLFHMVGLGTAGISTIAGMFEGGLTGAFVAAVVLLPSLFTPTAASEDDPPGQPVEGWYSLRRAFRPEHAGALPFYHIWLLTVVGAIVAAMAADGVLTLRILGPILLCIFYVSGLGFLFWSLSRRAAVLVAGATAARALSFIFFAILLWFPIALLGILFMTSSASDQDNSPLAWVWIFRPLTKMDPRSWADGAMLLALVWTGLLTYALGVIVNPGWRCVVPGGKRRQEAAHVASSES